MIVLSHELGHALAAILVGLDVLEITLGLGPRLFSFGIFSLCAIPIGGSFVAEGSFTPTQQFIVALAGPLINILSASILYLLFKFYLSYSEFWDDFMFYAFFWGVFNLLPFPFLDGGKVLTAFVTITEATEVILSFIGLVFIVSYSVFNFIRD